ncbi:hypothetical protein, partial [Staphylococcus epidermidis]|uniref:hypothetical protein n=1 Tax=Staphylococcus epidermidis TaxID=1282 RepID=UPI0037D9C1E1
LYQKLIDSYHLLYDHPKEPARVKFNHSHLIPLPVPLLLGKTAEQRILQVKQPINPLTQQLQIHQLHYYLQQLFNNIN